jgi:peptide/nickel transport system substrate-binding protein
MAAVRRLVPVLLTVALIACQPPGSPRPAAAPAASPSVPAAAIPARYSPEPAPREGGTVSVGDWQLPSALPAIYPQPAGAVWIEQALFSGLVGVDPVLGYYGDLASQVPTLENGAVKQVGPGMDVTYTLRTGLRWSDGQPITPDDVIFTWHASQSQDGYDRISGIDRAGDSFTVHFRSVYPAYSLLFSVIVPAHRLAPLDPAKLPVHAG